MTTDDSAEEWQWQLVVEEDGLTVVHVCRQTGREEPLSFEPSECAVRCTQCGEGLRVRRSEGWE
jgi:hypothetical protein